MKSNTRNKVRDQDGNEITQVAIYVAVTSPFTLVTFDDDDQPDFTVEQVQTKSYDRVKLCRTTTTLDPKLSSMGRIAVIVSYTGALLFPRMPGVSEEDVLASANRLLLAMTFGGIDYDAVAPDDIGYGFIYGTGYFQAGGGATGANFSKLVALQYRDVRSMDAMMLLHPRVRTSSDLHEAVRKGSPVVDGIPEISPNLFLNGLTYYRQKQLAPSLVFLWSTCESLIERLWIDHVVPTGKGIVGRKKFIEGNGWHAAQKIEVLFQTGLISDNLYDQLNNARNSRNKLAHKATIPTIDNCKDALYCAFKLVSIIRSAKGNSDEFDKLAKRLATTHDPKTGPIKPTAWRHLPAVPGDVNWQGNYARHPEIELVPLTADDFHHKASKK